MRITFEIENDRIVKICQEDMFATTETGWELLEFSTDKQEGREG